MWVILFHFGLNWPPRRLTPTSVSKHNPSVRWRQEFLSSECSFTKMLSFARGRVAWRCEQSPLDIYSLHFVVNTHKLLTICHLHKKLALAPLEPAAIMVRIPTKLHRQKSRSHIFFLDYRRIWSYNALPLLSPSWPDIYNIYNYIYI